jgi:hypothetical protein
MEDAYLYRIFLEEGMENGDVFQYFFHAISLAKLSTSS